MKKIFLFLTAAVLFTACSDKYDDSALRNELDDLKDKVSALEQQIGELRQAAATINDEIAAMSAIANGIAITQVESIADGYKITFSNGKSYEITKGAKGDKGDQGDQGESGAPSNPLLRINGEGYWQVSYDGGTTWEYPNGEQISAFGSEGDKGADGAQGITPQLGVDDEGYWIVSYDEGASWARLKDQSGSDIKAVAEGTATAPATESHFASVTLSADGSTLEIVLAGSTDVISIPVGGKALVTIKLDDKAVEGVQTFTKGESRTYTIEAAAQYLSLVGYPEGWQAVLEAQQLTVTAPATTVAAATRATADSESEISVLVVLQNGMATVARIEVAINGEEPAPNPDPEPAPDPNPSTGEEKVYRLVAAELTADELGIPSNKAGLQSATGPHNWTLNGVTFESFMVHSTTNNSADESTPVFYFYKESTAGLTYLKNTSSLGEIVSVKLMLIDSGKKKGNVFTMVERIGGVEQSVLSSNDNTTAEEHLYTFTAGNDGTFCFKGGDQDGKVLSFEITYK